MSAVQEGSSPSWRHAMWTAESRAFVGDFGAGQALSDEQYALLVPLIPRPSPGAGRAAPTCGVCWTACSTWYARAATGGTCRRPRPSPWRAVRRARDRAARPLSADRRGRPRWPRSRARSPGGRDPGRGLPRTLPDDAALTVVDVAGLAGLAADLERDVHVVAAAGAPAAVNGPVVPAVGADGEGLRAGQAQVVGVGGLHPVQERDGTAPVARHAGTAAQGGERGKEWGRESERSRKKPGSRGAWFERRELDGVAEVGEAAEEPPGLDLLGAAVGGGRGGGPGGGAAPLHVGGPGQGRGPGPAHPPLCGPPGPGGGGAGPPGG